MKNTIKKVGIQNFEDLFAIINPAAWIPYWRGSPWS
ncbi:hypothetical protein [Mycoplasmopsis bovis]